MCWFIVRVVFISTPYVNVKHFFEVELWCVSLLVGRLTVHRDPCRIYYVHGQLALKGLLPLQKGHLQKEAASGVSFA
jgi:hypothetical protein